MWMSRNDSRIRDANREHRLHDVVELIVRPLEGEGANTET